MDRGKRSRLDVKNFETEEELDEAINKIKYAWRETCEDGSDYDIDPEDYEDEDEYEDALEEAKERAEEEDDW